MHKWIKNVMPDHNEGTKYLLRWNDSDKQHNQVISTKLVFDHESARNAAVREATTLQEMTLRQLTDYRATRVLHTDESTEAIHANLQEPDGFFYALEILFEQTTDNTTTHHHSRMHT